MSSADPMDEAWCGFALLHLDALLAATPGAPRPKRHDIDAAIQRLEELDTERNHLRLLFGDPPTPRDEYTWDGDITHLRSKLVDEVAHRRRDGSKHMCLGIAVNRAEVAQRYDLDEIREWWDTHQDNAPRT